MNYPGTLATGRPQDQDSEPHSDSAQEPGHEEPAHDDPAHEEPGHDPAHDNTAHTTGEPHADDHHEADLSTMQGRMDHYLGADHLIGHVQDTTYFELPAGNFQDTVKVPIPNPMAAFGITEETPITKAPESVKDFVGPISFVPTKFVVLEIIGALLVAAIFIPYARRVQNGDRPKGRFWNMIDVMICYVKKDIAEAAIGSHDAKQFLPLLWTIFFFVLSLNLLGMIPTFGAATGSISVTAAFALIVFVTVLATGTKKMGVIGFWKNQVPHMDLPAALGIFLIPMIWVIEVFGLLVKHVVLAVRLFANMFAGHLVVAVFVAFIGVAGWTLASLGVVPVVITASVAVNLLELLVAFIQAYVFTFLSALFIGAAVHPH